ncbi:RNA polymerase sigma-70 factor [candidate division KSB1 bacterium]|nr:RNA polymerase sigma-70 factor [candidate division KSB1 bacterium]
MLQLDPEHIDLEKIHQGDKNEFEKLYRRFCQSLILFANKYVYKLDIAENIVQDVFVNIWQNRTTLDPTCNIKTYLFTSVKNHALNYIKRQRIERRYKETIVIDERNDQTPEIQYNLNELEVQINKTVEKLPEKRRIIFLMSRQDHLTYAEIAEVLGISVKTVENQMGKALKTLRSYLSNFISLIV